MTDRQQLIVNNVDTAKQLILDAERWIWAHPQTGYTEWQAHDYLVEKYEALGYTLVKADILLFTSFRLTLVKRIGFFT